MNRFFGAVALGLGLLVFSTDAFADWTVVRSSGTVWLVAPDSTARAPLEGEVVPNSWMLATGADGRLLLMRGNETITVSPNSQMVVTEYGASTQVIQPVGTVEFDVEVRPFRHFVVETPVLAAVVKGTRFIVSTDGITGWVRVERGAVEVKSMGTGQATLVATGQQVLVPGLNSALQLAAIGQLPNYGAPAGATVPLVGGVPALVGETVATIPGAVGATINSVVETVVPVVETVTEVVEDATDAVTDIVEDTTEVVTDIVGGALGGLGGLLGGGL